MIIVSIIYGQMNQSIDDGHLKGCQKMIGIRVARKYIEKLTDQDLHGLYETAKKDDSQEALVIQYLIICELNQRKTKHK